MDRRVLPVMVAVALAVGCSRPSPQPTAEVAATPALTPIAPPATNSVPKPAKEAFKKVDGPLALIRIGVDGTPRPETLEIDNFKKNETTIVWVADCPAETLTVAFKTVCDGQTKPGSLKDPSCEDIACALDAKRFGQVTKKTEVCYSVVVTVPGQAPVTVDPKLIINP